MIHWLLRRIDAYRKRRARAVFLQRRRLEHPDCWLADSSEVVDSVLGKHVTLHGSTRVRTSTIGDHTYLATGAKCANTTIGKYCSIGQRVQIGLARHPLDHVSTYPAFFALDNEGCRETFVESQRYDEQPLPTRIGHDVWICNNALVPGGITIENGAVVAAGAVVTRDVPAYAIVGGNPARTIRYRFSREDIDYLLRIAWWNWSDERIRRLASAFSDVSRLRAATADP